ncbi:MAG: ATP-binding protein [Kofleriaceae bacterium]|nr:MAG: ATP-binding protein [Kofleriaceae bacterium]MBZ0238223.1 ATP-binding protein [Kofleriaceae bacterium]
MGSASVIRLTSPCTLRHRALAVRLVAEACRLARGEGTTDEQSMGYDLRDPFDAEIVSAFAEIYNNIVLHAYARREGETIDIAIHVGAGSLTIEIRDSGKTFDPSSVPEPDLDSLPEGGMGLHIARAMLDEVVYEPGPPNLWRLIKRHRPTAATTKAS